MSLGADVHSRSPSFRVSLAFFVRAIRVWLDNNDHSLSRWCARVRPGVLHHRGHGLANLRKPWRIPKMYQRTEDGHGALPWLEDSRQRCESNLPRPRRSPEVRRRRLKGPFSCRVDYQYRLPTLALRHAQSTASVSPKSSTVQSAGTSHATQLVAASRIPIHSNHAF